MSGAGRNHIWDTLPSFFAQCEEAHTRHPPADSLRLEIQRLSNCVMCFILYMHFCMSSDVSENVYFVNESQKYKYPTTQPAALDVWFSCKITDFTTRSDLTIFTRDPLRGSKLNVFRPIKDRQYNRIENILQSWPLLLKSILKLETEQAGLLSLKLEQSSNDCVPCLAVSEADCQELSEVYRTDKRDLLVTLFRRQNGRRFESCDQMSSYHHIEH